MRREATGRGDMQIPAGEFVWLYPRVSTNVFMSLLLLGEQTVNVRDRQNCRLTASSAPSIATGQVLSRGAILLSVLNRIDDAVAVCVISSLRLWRVSVRSKL